MSARRIAVVALLLAACHPTRPCRDGTVFVDLSGIAGADRLHVDVTVAGQALSGDQPYAGQPGIEIDFPSGYPSGQAIRIKVTAFKNSSALASGTISDTLAGSCAHLSLALDSDGGALPGNVSVVGVTTVPPPGATIALPMPVGTHAGDYLVLCVYANSSTETAQLPAGWATLSELTSDQGFHVWWLTRLADASLAPATVSFNGTAKASAVLVAYRGVDPAQPVDSGSSPMTLTGTATAAQIAFVAPSLMPTGTHDRMAVFFVFDSGDGSTWADSPMSSFTMTKLADTGSIVLYDGALPGAGPTASVTGTASFTPSDSLYGTGLALALAPR